MFNFHKVDGDSHHFIIEADEPVRVEVVKVKDGIIAHGYKGTKVDQDQEPDLVFDRTVE